ncbi:hypothetical protein [Streptacidiphilus sp. P02-A3a]|uniref:hypothetical protein n=1 Tax=Streptacidiphilus sp. P02-A3a TaxID=2704468 RepID=UPI0015FDD726|nr:hypothetical protein [Streptacidiphilus sp. P02-A3a]QMU71392.1 hypothetical protein GXP74_27330 [Streptacidiphilus sp. P02-A3a]
MSGFVLLLRRVLPLAAAAALAVLALAVPGAASARAATPDTVTSVCANQAVPSGDIVTAVSASSACDGYLLYTVAPPSNGATLCTVGVAVPYPYVIIAGTTTAQPQCDNQFETQTITQPYNGIVVCFGGTLPTPYVITDISTGSSSACSGRTMTLEQETPGITACQNTIKWNNYVATADGTGGACAGYGTEVLNPVHNGIVACGVGAGPSPTGYVITEVWSSYSGCGQYEGLEYNAAYNGMLACSNSTLPSGWSASSYRTDSLCSPFEGEILAS